MSKTIPSPYRYDFVGSFLRPENLKQARGFASCEVGNKLTEEEQWAKLALVKEIAEEVWG